MYVDVTMYMFIFTHVHLHLCVYVQIPVSMCECRYVHVLQCASLAPACLSLPRLLLVSLALLGYLIIIYICTFVHP